MLPLDTTHAAHLAHLRVISRLTPAARVELAVSMSEDTRTIACAGIAVRHPDYSAAQVTSALQRLLLGDDLFQRAWPRAPLLAP